MPCKTGVEHIKSLRDGRAVYIDGKRVKNLKGASKIQEFKQMIEEYVVSHYGQTQSRSELH